MTVCWCKETALDSIVKIGLLNVINLCCSNLSLYQYHHSFNYLYLTLYFILILNIVNCFVDNCNPYLIKAGGCPVKFSEEIRDGLCGLVDNAFSSDPPLRL